MNANFWHGAIARHGGGTKNLDFLNLGDGLEANHARRKEILVIFAFLFINPPFWQSSICPSDARDESSLSIWASSPSTEDG